MAPSIEELSLGPDDLARYRFLRLGEHGVEQPLEHIPPRGHGYDREAGPLPQLLVSDLRDRQVVVVSQAALQALEDLPLVLERDADRKIKLESQHPDVHGSDPGCELRAG